MHNYLIIIYKYSKKQIKINETNYVVFDKRKKKIDEINEKKN